MQGRGKGMLKSYENINNAFEKPVKCSSFVESSVAFQGGVDRTSCLCSRTATGSSCFYCGSFVLIALHKKEKMFLSSINRL